MKRQFFILSLWMWTVCNAGALMTVQNCHTNMAGIKPAGTDQRWVLLPGQSVTLPAFVVPGSEHAWFVMDSGGTVIDEWDEALNVSEGDDVLARIVWDNVQDHFSSVVYETYAGRVKSVLYGMTMAVPFLVIWAAIYGAIAGINPKLERI